MHEESQTLPWFLGAHPLMCWEEDGLRGWADTGSSPGSATHQPADPEQVS